MAKSRLHVFLCTLCFCFIITVAFTQKLFIGTKYQVETGVYLSTFQTPFWLRTNQYGIVPLESQFLTFRGAAHKDYSKQVEEKRAKRFDFGYGFSSVINVGKSNHLYLQELNAWNVIHTPPL
jgi:hypothetical protein